MVIGEMVDVERALDAATFVFVYGIAWNVLIANYAEHDHVEETLKWFLSMSCEGLSLDTTIFVDALWITLECVYGIACKLVDCFRLLWSTQICFLSHCLTQDMLGKNILYVVDVMTPFLF